MQDSNATAMTMHVVDLPCLMESLLTRFSVTNFHSMQRPHNKATFQVI
jgi:hypothetical protein